jgi:uncharacterized protein
VSKPYRPDGAPETDVSSPLAFLDIAGLDTDRLITFYRNVFGWTIAPDGSFEIPTMSALPVAIRRDPAEMRCNLGVDDVASVLALVESERGTVDSYRFEVPGVAIIGLFRDPAGNPSGLVEMDGGRPKVP